MTVTTVFSGQHLSDFEVTSGNFLDVRSGGSVRAITVDDGAAMQCEGVARATTISGVALEELGPLGLAIGTTLAAGAIEVVMGISRDAIVRDGGSEVVSGGTTFGDTVSSGGLEKVLAGFASGTIVSNHGVLRIEKNFGVGAHVEAGGIETILSGGTASATVISGGYEFDDGLAFGTVIRSGGHEEVQRGAIASGSVISSGGREIVSSAGLAVAAKLFNGGVLIVSSGGSISGGLTIHAGSATINGTMAEGQTVSFAGAAGTLKLNNLSAFGAAISGFGGAPERIDLGGFAFGASETATWAQTGTSGTLTVQDGAKIAGLTLIGTYATSDFMLSRDGHGGSFIKESTSPGAVAATTRFTQAVAGLEGGRSAAGLAAIHGGGSAMVAASPLVGVATSGR